MIGRDLIPPLGPAEGLCRLSARELRAGFLAGEFSPVEVLDAVAARIKVVEPSVEAFTTLMLEEARAAAVQAERAYRTGDSGRSLLGVPVAVKDLLDTAGTRTTYGSAMFSHHVPLRDATAVQRLKDAGTIIVGKSATHEFSWGITTNNFHFGPTRNPWALDRTPGGSSGGSAVALATGCVPLAVGTDTGGSIRIPAAFCGVVGMRPTYGRTSKAGVFPLAPSIDQVGPMARTPHDARLLLDVLGGIDPDDPSSCEQPIPDDVDMHDSLVGVRVGILADQHQVPLSPDIAVVFEQAAVLCEDLGARVVEVDIPEADLAYETFGVIQRAEAAFVHERAGLFPRVLEYGPDVRGRLERAAEVTLGDYLAACADRQRIRARVHEVFRTVDLLLTPVSSTSPPIVGDEHVLHRDRRLLFREAVMVHTVLQSLAGVPACSVRAGFDALGIPIGVQFSGPAWSDERVLTAASCFYGAATAIQDRWAEPPAIAPGQSLDQRATQR